MYSTKCLHCHQLINLKTEEVRQAINQTEAEHKSHYEMKCPKCRKPIKIRVEDLKRKLPPVAAPAEETTPAETAPEATSEESGS